MEQKITTWNSELPVPTDSMCHRKILTYPFPLYIKAVSRNSSEFSELLLWPETQSCDIWDPSKTRSFTLDTKVQNSEKRFRLGKNLHVCSVQVTSLQLDQITLQPKFDLNNVTCIYTSIYRVMFYYFGGHLKYE